MGEELPQDIACALPLPDDDWRSTKARIEALIDNVWSEEPEEFRRVRLGVIEGGVGTGGQSFSVLVHLEAYLMMDGTDIVYCLLKATSDKRTLTTSDIRYLTRTFLVGTFNHFTFLKDLGLPTLGRVGDNYTCALDKVQNKAKFVRATALDQCDA